MKKFSLLVTIPPGMEAAAVKIQQVESIEFLDKQELAEFYITSEIETVRENE